MSVIRADLQPDQEWLFSHTFENKMLLLCKLLFVLGLLVLSSLELCSSHCFPSAHLALGRALWAAIQEEPDLPLQIMLSLLTAENNQILKGLDGGLEKNN